MAVRELKPLRVVASPIASDSPSARASTEIYRPFFLAGILSVLTAGCALGAFALLGIALNASYTASAWTPYVLAHANSQLYGWVGFFVMGFALQQHAPTVGKARLFHRLAAWSLGLMAAGIALRFVAEPMVRIDRELWLPIGIGSCWLQTAAVALFFVNTTVTRYRGGAGLGWQTNFVFASLFWWLLVVAAEPYYFAASHAANPTNGILFVAEWFPPYREAQFLGFVANMVFGVALVKMNSCFGAKPACPYFGQVGFLLWNLGLAARMVGWLVFFRGGLEPQAGFLYNAGGVALAFGAVAVIASTRMFLATEFTIPSHKFVRAAFAWLLIAGALMILEPMHLAAIGQPFSHAYIGSIRHAVTVGFISQMIIGVSMHVVARMNDLDPANRPQLWSVFWLLNLGNAARVGLEITTDYTGAAFLPMGVTGFVELTALAIWAAVVARPMLASMRRQRLARAV